MRWDVAGLGNALMDALVVLDDDGIIQELGLVRGTMHPVDHPTWQQAYARVVGTHEVSLESGGSCANTIATVGRLGGRAIYCGQVGDDQLGRVYAARMTDACGTHQLRVSPDEPTGKCLSIIGRSDAERTMLTDLGAAVSLPEIGDFGRTLAQTDIAHFTGYTLLDAPMREVVLEAVRLARAAGCRISLDAADPFVVAQTRGLLWELISGGTDVVFLNAEEARGLTGEAPEDAIWRIAESGVNTVVVKLGARGSLVLSADELVRIPIHEVEALDTTGAGDAYAGGFLFGRARGRDPETCGHMASSVAALTVAQIGAVVKDPALLHDALRRVS